MHRETPIRRLLLQTGSPRAAENSHWFAVRIEFPVSCRKQRTGLSPNRYKKPDPFASFCKINRKPARIEFPVSHRKQRADSQINRQLSCPESAAVRRSNGSGTLASRESGFPIPNTLHPKLCPACPDAGRESATVRRSNGSRARRAPPDAGPRFVFSKYLRRGHDVGEAHDAGSEIFTAARLCAPEKAGGEK